MVLLEPEKASRLRFSLGVRLLEMQQLEPWTVRTWIMKNLEISAGFAGSGRGKEVDSPIPHPRDLTCTIWREEIRIASKPPLLQSFGVRSLNKQLLAHHDGLESTRLAEVWNRPGMAFTSRIHGAIN